MRLRKARYALAFTLGLVVAAMGYITSFDHLATYADQHGFLIPQALPIGLDFGIPALLLLDSLRPSAYLRWCAWMLTAFTVFANAAVTPDGGIISAVLYAVMPTVAVVFFEAARHLREEASRMDRIRLSRYLVSPVRTTRLRVRMIRWEVTSYADALRLESAILLARTVLVAEYQQRTWRRTRRSVPAILAHQLNTGQLPDGLFFGIDWTTAVRAWVRDALDELDPHRPAAPARNAQPEADRAADPAAAEPDPWERIWEHRDRLVPEGVTPEVFAKAHGLARWHFAQFGRHIIIKDLRRELGVRNVAASALARLFQSAYEYGPERAVPSAFRPPSAAPAVDGIAGTTPEGAVPDVPAGGLSEALGASSRNGQGPA